MKKRVRIVVSGHVQGVSFRAYAQQAARSLGLQGYVRNLADGDVEIVAQGEPEKLDRLVEWARTGSPLARVVNIEVEPLEPDNDLHDFTIRY